MDEIITDFYVSLPSNASMHYFPQNSPSSYRTKLHYPLHLSGQWEVALTECFIPRNWWNIGEFNNEYTVSIDSEKIISVENVRHEIKITFHPDKDVTSFFIELNEQIERITGKVDCVKFMPDIELENVSIDISEGFEVHLSGRKSDKLLYMFHLPNEDIILKKTSAVKFRTTTELKEQTFIIINKNPLKSTTHLIPLARIKESKSDDNNSIFTGIIKNIEWLQLQDYLSLDHKPITNELEIKVSKYAKLIITENKAKSLLRILNQQQGIELTGVETFIVNPLLDMDSGEFIELMIKEYPEGKLLEKKVMDLFINAGIYNTPKSLFEEFQYIRLKQLPNLKVSLEVPPNCEVNFNRGLADMLGFVDTRFKTGKYSSKYVLELDAGITEIFIYSDLIVSHHVGDTYAPLLRIIPCMNEKKDQIVKQYEAPIYFPLRNNFVDTIEIELKTTAGKSITFTSGKTFVLLSFRRKKIL